MRWLQSLGVSLLVLAAGSGQASAQQFGQWWWNGEASAIGRSLENASEGETTSGSRQFELQLAGSMAGYIVHPAIGKFELGLDLRFSQVEGGKSVDTDRWGFLAEVELQPQSALPILIFARKEIFDYSDVPDEERFVLLGAPESSTSWGGSLGIRRGILRGSIFGVDRTEIDFRDPDAATEIREREYFNWNLPGNRFSRVIRLERRFQKYGTVDFTSEDYTLTGDQNGDIAPGWRWNLGLVGVSREVESSTSATRLATGRLRSNLTHAVNDDVFRLTYALGTGDREDLRTTVHELTTSYQWRVGAGWNVGPSAGYVLQRNDSATIQAPRVGGFATWSRNTRRLAFQANGNLAYQWIEGRAGDEGGSGSTIAYSGQATVGLQADERTRAELEVGFSRNDVGAAGGTVPDLPGYGLLLPSLGVEDLYRGRFTFNHGWRWGFLRGFSEFRRRTSSPEDLVRLPFEATTLSHNLTMTFRRLNFAGILGSSVVDGTEITRQEVEFAGADLTWAPRPYLRLRASYRLDKRNVELALPVDSERIEAAVVFGLGLLQAEVLYFESVETLPGLPGRSNRGVRWFVTRRFGGWLPFVSAPQRRGEIR